MKKYFKISQPPLTAKYTFLVDDINEMRNWGMTTDIDKIEYNRDLLGDDFNIDIKIKLLLTKKGGGTFVIPIGRYITVFEIREDENEGRMTFFDFTFGATREELQIMLEIGYSETIVNEWLKCYDLMSLEFTSSSDTVVLLKPSEIGV